MVDVGKHTPPNDPTAEVRELGIYTPTPLVIGSRAAPGVFTPWHIWPAVQPAGRLPQFLEQEPSGTELEIRTEVAESNDMYKGCGQGHGYYWLQSLMRFV